MKPPPCSMHGWLRGLLFCTTLPLLISSCHHYKMSKKEINQYLSQHHQEGVFKSYEAGKNRVIHYLKVGSDTLPRVIFVHGSPGSLSAFIELMADTALLRKVQLISVDRPGFGQSDFGKAEPDLGKQAGLLKPLIEQSQGHVPLILVGHSMGGPVVVRMAMDYGELIDGLVLVAGAFDPELEPDQTWWRGPLATPFLNWTLPRTIRASNDELYKLKPELYEMLPLWPKVHNPVIMIHGGMDSRVPYENAEFARRRLVNASSIELITKEDMDHFVPWTNPELIRRGILRMLEIAGTPAIQSQK